MDKALVGIDDGVETKAFADGGHGFNGDSRSMEIRGLAKEVLGIGNAADFGISGGTSHPGGDDHFSIQGVSQGFQFQEQAKIHFLGETVAVFSITITGKFVTGKVVGRAVTVKGNDAECFGEKPVFGEWSHQTVGV